MSLSICSQVSIEKGESCTLHDNSQRVKWKVTSTHNVEAVVPGACFVLPPPDKDALDLAERLQRQFDRSVALWQKKQLRMRQNMIFATIKVVKSWDLAQVRTFYFFIFNNIYLSYEHNSIIAKSVSQYLQKKRLLKIWSYTIIIVFNIITCHTFNLYWQTPHCGSITVENCYHLLVSDVLSKKQPLSFQFLAMGQDQRNAIRKALNEDADKLLQEGDPNDPQLRRLRREMDEVNRLFDEFERKAKLEGESQHYYKNSVLSAFL